jgi:hypothetical protein
MRQLARTLLILGSVSACERAQPLEDVRARPAVGNIGQTGRPKPAAIAEPLVDASGAPAVGNIGQTGAPRRDRVKRAQRAAARPLVSEARPQVSEARPLVNEIKRPMVGNVMQKGGAPKQPVELAIQQHSSSAEAQRPLRDRRERPAVANMGRRGHMVPTDDDLAVMQRAIAFEQESLRLDPDDDDAKFRLVELQKRYERMRSAAHEARQAR